MSRHEELLNSIDILLAAHSEWQATDNPELSADLVQRIEDAITVWSGGDMPGDLLDLYSKMKGLNETWTETVMQADDPDHIQTARAGSFWKCLDGIRNDRLAAEEEDTAEFRPLESIAMLTAQKVPDAQICRIYRGVWPEGAKKGPGLWDYAKDRPLLNLLEKERKEPGSVIDDKFVPFYVAQRQAEAQRRKAAAERASRVRQDRIAKLTKPCPETLAELVEQGVSLTQIAQMKKTTKAEIRKQCVAENLPIPKEEYEAPTSDFNPAPNESQERIDQAERPLPKKQKQAERVQGSAEEDSTQDESAIADDEFAGADEFDTPEDLEGGDEPVSQEEQLVAQYLHSGVTVPGDIAKAIKADGGPEMRAGDVKRIMGELKGDPERMAAALGSGPA